MLLGLRTAIYHVPDVEQGRDWYTKVLGIQPTSISRSTSAGTSAASSWG
jgi:hypothetical protein